MTGPKSGYIDLSAHFRWELWPIKLRVGHGWTTIVADILMRSLGATARTHAVSHEADGTSSRRPSWAHCSEASIHDK